MTLPEFDVPLAILIATVAIAGVARGLSGFGTGMIVAPVAAALYGPKAALVIIVIIDSIPTVPLTLPVMKIARWREVLPVAVGLALFLPFGIYILKNGDPTVLRWCICIAILVCAAGLWGGWRYDGPRGLPVSFGVGGIAGTLGGIASIPGPPVIFYWLASTLPGAVVRANLLTLFLLGEFLSIGNLWAAGLFERSVVMLGIVAAPLYFVGLLGGWRLYGLASETTYRRVTFCLILGAALLAMPAVEPLFRAMARWAA
ncbi:sulfite exporter TauE/SafE family protein [Mesorhizobium xinjiangense]|uniref:sulfite exporter TauE/SafE family protein n=1 Tax=Mesorhizobium xinjiangense TaxID=2678685 RepID=UPI0012EDCB59|nr:sulfite exporter TauE/SafE family protein [Mesorhizobium xinjiangense]